MKVYLDLCCFNRPFDDQSSLAIYIETQAKLGIQDLIEGDMIYLVWSFMTDYENSANPDSFIRREIFHWREKAISIINKNESILKKAEELHLAGFGKKDALHIASAIDAAVDYFITVDKGIINKKEKVSEINICSPVDFISILEEKNNEK